jgi:hypothetical protein
MGVRDSLRRIPPRRDVSRFAAVLNLTRFTLRPMSRSSRTRVSVRRGLARLIAGIAAATLLVAAQASDHVQRGAFVDALHSITPAATSPVVPVFPPQRLAAATRSSTHWSSGLGAALPAVARTIGVGDTTDLVATSTSLVAKAAAMNRGYDATAPPALS